MKVLLATYANKAHLHMMTPLAWALWTAGHEVRVASQPELADEILRVGLTPVSVGDVTHALEKAPEFLANPGKGTARRQVMPSQRDYGEDDPIGELADVVENAFSLFSPDRTIDDLVDFARNWQPDLVLWDSSTYAAPVAARACGAAHSRVLWGTDALAQLRSAVGPDRDPMRDWMQPILQRHGLDFDEELAFGHWTVDPMPPWQWRPPGVNYVPVRHIPFNPPAPVPDWLAKKPERERVCLTLGLTHRDHIGVEPFIGELIDAVADLDVEVVATLNAGQLERVPTVPDNLRVVDYVPLHELLSTCSAVVHHGGAKTFATAIDNAVPQLFVPTAYYCLQWWGALAHANGVVEQGAGLYVSDSDHFTSAALREDVVRVLTEPSFRENAVRLRDETKAVPTPSDLVPVLERLTAIYRDRPAR